VRSELSAHLEVELASAAPEVVVKLAESLADPIRDAVILYYGSTLRTGDLSGILDFYRLTRLPHRRGLRGLVEAFLWPEVSYHEVEIDGALMRAKVATMPLAQFRRAAEGRTLDTTIWARFVQPTQRVWSADEVVAGEANAACAAAVVTAARYAAALGPDRGVAEDYWAALFRKTYAAEFRVEAEGRADTVIAGRVERYVDLLPLAWRDGGVAFDAQGGTLRPDKRGLPGWRLVSLAGKPLNVARLAKAAFTFDGAARYSAWKIERHTGVVIAVTPFAERYPLLAAPGALLQLRRGRRARRSRVTNDK
jgi:hypothetical protein